MKALQASLLLVSALALAGGTAVPARAGTPDVDGSVAALIATPFEPAGSALGGAGLVSACAIGLAADLVALVDDNPYSRVLLRGLASRPLDRTALGVSQLSTGGLEGLRVEDRVRFPEDRKIYVDAPESAEGRLHERLHTFVTGVGALLPLSVADAVVNPILMLTRIAGAESASQDLESWHDHLAAEILGPTQ